MTPEIVKILATACAIGACIATIWAPPEADAVLLALATGIVGSVWIRRPGDAAP